MPGLSFLTKHFSRRHQHNKSGPASDADTSTHSLAKPAPPQGAVSLVATTTISGPAKESKRRESKVRGWGHPSVGAGGWRRGGGEGRATNPASLPGRGRLAFFLLARRRVADRASSKGGEGAAPGCRRGATPRPPPHASG